MSLDPETFGQLLDTVRRFVAERLVPREAEVAEADRIPDDLLDEMRALGFFGLSIPEDYGGIGGDFRHRHCPTGLVIVDQLKQAHGDDQ